MTDNGSMTSYPTPEFRRTALAPGILGAIVLLSGLALLDSVGGFLIIRYVVAILAIIVAFFSFQARQWWWIPPLLAIAVVWNPILPFAFHGQVWVGSQFIATAVFIAAGLLVKIRNPEDRNRRPARTGSNRR